MSDVGHPIVPLPRGANPGAAGNVTIFDSHPAGIPLDVHADGRRTYERMRTAIFTNVADATLIVEQQAAGSSSFRNIATVTIPANTYFQRDTLLQPGRTRIRTVTVTNPTTWECTNELVRDHALGQ